MHDYQREFIEFLVRSGALRFGAFTLKSGRTSPYFFNSGEFSRGEQIERLGYYYASAIHELETQPSVIFGPAYKGIPLSISAAIALNHHFEQDVAYSFDRKEEKDHGEGGWMVGHVPGEGDRIVLVDDVVTDGATKVASIESLRESTEGEVTGLVIAVDRRKETPTEEIPSRRWARRPVWRSDPSSPSTTSWGTCRTARSTGRCRSHTKLQERSNRIWGSTPYRTG